MVWDTRRATLQGLGALRQTIDYLFERITIHPEDCKQLGLIVRDRPGGGKKEEALLEDVVRTMEKGTVYVKCWLASVSEIGPRQARLAARAGQDRQRFSCVIFA